MKIALVLCAVAVAALANPVQNKWNEVHRECQRSHALHVDDSIFEQLKRGGHPRLPPNFGAHANCMLVKLDLQDGQGNIKQYGVRQAVERTTSNSATVTRIVNECSANQNSKEDTALALFGCLGKNNVNIGQL